VSFYAQKGTKIHFARTRCGIWLKVWELGADGAYSKVEWEGIALHTCVTCAQFTAVLTAREHGPWTRVLLVTLVEDDMTQSRMKQCANEMYDATLLCKTVFPANFRRS